MAKRKTKRKRKLSYKRKPRAVEGGFPGIKSIEDYLKGK